MVKVVDAIRPRTWNEYQGQEEFVTAAKRFVQRMDMPDIICVGPPGSGKTTGIKILASQMLGGADVWTKIHPDFKILNASDERGIDVVRTDIKEFSGAIPASNSPFRILVLEEGDKLTKDAQDAMRAIVEDNSDTCRFVWSGNDENYIDAIKSRCAIFYFSAIPNDVAARYFVDVSAKYKVTVPLDVATNIATMYEGDLRKMFNDCLEKLIGIDHPVTAADVSFDGSLKASVISIMAELNAGKDEMDSYSRARKLFTSEHSKHKFNIKNFLKQLHDMIGSMNFELAEQFAKCDANLAHGGIKEIQVGALLARMARWIKSSK